MCMHVRVHPLTNVVSASLCISYLPPFFHSPFPPPFSTSQCKRMNSSLLFLLYLIHIRCVAAGVGLREIEAHLDKRSLKVYTTLCLSLYECILSFTLALSSHTQSPLTLSLLSHSYSPLTLILSSNTYTGHQATG